MLLDTHVLFWLVAGDTRQCEAARQRIEASAGQQSPWISAITPWEIGMLVARNRLVLDRDVTQWVQAALALTGIRVAPLEPAVAVASTRLPGQLHGDPADPLIVATGRHLGATLVTADAVLLAYATPWSPGTARISAPATGAPSAASRSSRRARWPNGGNLCIQSPSACSVIECMCSASPRRSMASA